MTFQGQTRTKKKTGTWFWVLFSPDLSYSWPVRELLLNAWHLYCSVASEVAQSCPILCDPIDCSPPGSSVHGILQARIMELVAILLSRVQLFVTVWTAACQASLFFTISQSLLKLISIELVMPSNHLILCHLLLQSLLASRSFLMGQFFTSGGQNIGASASASVLPMNIQDWFPLGLTDLYQYVIRRAHHYFLPHLLILNSSLA